MAELGEEIAALSACLDMLCEEYERLRPGIGNVQFRSAGGYLFGARTYLFNAKVDYERGHDVSMIEVTDG